MINIDSFLKDLENFSSWKEDWDDQGAKSFKKETILRVKNFILDCDNYIKKLFGYDIVAPEILPAPDGSLSLFWTAQENSGKYILVCIQESPLPIMYHGKNYWKQSIDGEGDTHLNSLYIWIYEEMKLYDPKRL